MSTTSHSAELAQDECGAIHPDYDGSHHYEGACGLLAGHPVFVDDEGNEWDHVHFFEGEISPDRRLDSTLSHTGNDETYCFVWMPPAIWPHASVDPFSVQTTTDRSKVTCLSCLHTLGSQKHAPPPDSRPCRGTNSNVCVAEGCHGEACVRSTR